MESKASDWVSEHRITPEALEWAYNAPIEEVIGIVADVTATFHSLHVLQAKREQLLAIIQDRNMKELTRHTDILIEHAKQSAKQNALIIRLTYWIVVLSVLSVVVAATTLLRPW